MRSRVRLRRRVRQLSAPAEAAIAINLWGKNRETRSDTAAMCSENELEMLMQPEKYGGLVRRAAIEGENEEESLGLSG